MEFLNSRELSIIDFDSHYPGELLELEKDINKTIDLCKMLLSNKSEIVKNDKLEFFFLILRSVDYLISALSLVRQRAFIEAGNIIRLCMETSSTAIHVNSNKVEFEKYKQNKYKSTDSIKYAESQIPGFGDLWGSLSKLIVHPNTYHGIYSELSVDSIVEKAEINFGVKIQNELQDKQMLVLLRITANIIFRCFEIIVSEKKRLKGTSGLYLKNYRLFMMGKSTEKLIYELMEKFKK